MKELTTEEKEQLWEEARKDHPGDSMLQEVRYVRLLHASLTKDMTIEERIQFYNRRASGEAQPAVRARKCS